MSSPSDRPEIPEEELKEARKQVREAIAERFGKELVGRIREESSGAIEGFIAELLAPLSRELEEANKKIALMGDQSAIAAEEEKRADSAEQLLADQKAAADEYATELANIRQIAATLKPEVMSALDLARTLLDEREAAQHRADRAERLVDQARSALEEAIEELCERAMRLTTRISEGKARAGRRKQLEVERGANRAAAALLREKLDDLATLTPDLESEEGCEHCKDTGHDWEPGPTGEPISIGPCPHCEAASEGSGAASKTLGDLTPEERREFENWLAAKRDPGTGPCGHPNHGGADHDCQPFLPDCSRQPSGTVSRESAKLVAAEALRRVGISALIEPDFEVGNEKEVWECPRHGLIEYPEVLVGDHLCPIAVKGGTAFRIEGICGLALQGPLTVTRIPERPIDEASRRLQDRGSGTSEEGA